MPAYKKSGQVVETLRAARWGRVTVPVDWGSKSLSSLFKMLPSDFFVSECALGPLKGTNKFTYMPSGEEN